MAWKDLSVKDRAGFIRQMVKLGINTPLEQENSYNYALGGKPILFHNDKAKEYDKGVNRYQQSWEGTYGKNPTPFITEKTYTTGPQWRQQNPSTQIITEKYYNRKFNEGIIPIVSALLGKDDRLEKKVVQKNRYDAYNNPISSVTRTVDYTQPFGQRRTVQRTEFGNSIGPRMNYVQKSLSENSRNIMENQQILNNAQSLIRGYGYGMKDKGGHLFGG